MPYSFDLPSDKRELGRVLRDAIEDGKVTDLMAPYVQAVAVRNYLNGDRNFEIVDPRDPSFPLMTVQSPRNQPACESIVGDVAKEIGRQSRIDIRPAVKIKDTTLNGIRDRAIAQGMLSYLFSRDVVSGPHEASQKLRTEEGGCGLAISETYRSGRGWGIKVEIIPIEEITLLPIGAKTLEQVTGMAWRRPASLKWLRGVVNKLGKTLGKRLSLPSEGSEDYKYMNVRKNKSAVNTDVGSSPMWGLAPEIASVSQSGGDNDQHVTPMVEFVQCYITPDRKHVERVILMAGDYVIHDQTYDEGSMPMMPLSYSPYVPVGGIYGRSYAYPKMMAHIAAERAIQALSKVVSEVNAYGILAARQNMGVEWDRVTQASDGSFRIVTFSSDPASPQSRIEQIAPIEISRVIGSIPNFMLQVADRVFPDSPIFQGQAPGRVDSDAAIHSLEGLSTVQIAAGARTLAEAWSQMYRAGLEMARDHYNTGEHIPLVLVDDAMAGVVLDTAEVPLSTDERMERQNSASQRASAWQMKGIDPMFAEALRQAALPKDEAGNPISDGSEQSDTQRVPIAQFTIGPNIIPHPDEVDIGIQSLMPRDEEKESMLLEAARQAGYASAIEVQIETMKRGLDRWLGGKAVWNTYRVAILNLLSAYGDGINPGQGLLPAAGTIHRIGYMVISTFKESPEFLLASETVKQKVLQLLEFYSPTNTAAGVPTADEAAMMQQMQQSQQMQGMSQAPPALPQMAA